MFLFSCAACEDLRSPTRDRTCPYAVHAKSLYHWMAREVMGIFDFVLLGLCPGSVK